MKFLKFLKYLQKIDETLQPSSTSPGDGKKYKRLNGVTFSKCWRSRRTDRVRARRAIDNAQGPAPQVSLVAMGNCLITDLPSEFLYWLYAQHYHARYSAGLDVETLRTRTLRTQDISALVPKSAPDTSAPVLNCSPLFAPVVTHFGTGPGNIRPSYG